MGSVGQPRDLNNQACHVILDTDEWRVTFKRVDYDIESAGEKIEGQQGDPPGVTHRQRRPHVATEEQLFDGCSGMLSFELQGGVEAALAFMQTVRLPIVAPSLGGPETLITRPATTSHSGLTPAERHLMMGRKERLRIADCGLRFP